MVNEITTDERMIAFGKRVREMRKSKGISQERLAEMAGIDRSYMGNIERGEGQIIGGLVLSLFLSHLYGDEDQLTRQQTGL